MIPVLGMHRSGTSALANALHKLGANLGAESAWIAPAADNPLGFFEYEPVVRVNRSILAAMGGTWSSPPPLPPGWTSDERLTDARREATELAADLDRDLVVKDPRLSLTLPLWDELIRPRPAVLCVRHPVAVARSLRERNGFTIDAGLFLWFRYTASAHRARPDALVVEYEELLARTPQQLALVAEHIELPVGSAVLDAASRAILDSMAHQASEDLPATPIGELCGQLYEALRSGSTAADLARIFALVTELPWAGPSDREIQLAQQRARSAELRADRLAAELERLHERAARLESDLRRANHSLDALAFDESASIATHLEDMTPT